MTVPHSPRRLRRALIATVSVSALTASALLVAPGAGATGNGTMEGYRKAALGSPVELTFTANVQKK